MTKLRFILVLVAAFLAVFWEAAFPSRWLKTQIDLIPALMVYASLSLNLPGLVALAVCGGLFFDSLSANPLGVSVMPLFIVGFLIFVQRELILRDQPYAQFVLGLAVSAISPLLTVLLLLTTGHQLLLGWGSLWQWLVMTVGGGIATPIIFFIVDWCERIFGPTRATESSFRPDREIRRGRN
jgi:rod shape-determining protein MreD